MGLVGGLGQELDRAMAVLKEAGVETPQLDAEALMSHVIGAPRVHVISHPDERLGKEAAGRFAELVKRRAKREPLAYITGEREFWGLTFEITPAVLVPRPETETLVEAALLQLRNVKDPVVAEIGAGTGCVAIALAIELPDAVVYTTELSTDAAEVAMSNASKHQVQVRVAVLAGNLLDPLPPEVRGKLDAVVSNPPYIPSGEIDSLQPEVARYEPRGALDGGPDGMKYHREILAAARDWLKPGGWVNMEVGMGQAEAVAGFARENGYRETRITKDLAGIGRVVSAES